MLNPDYPVIEGIYYLDSEWLCVLPNKFNKRVEGTDIVFWRPGITVWVALHKMNSGMVAQDLYEGFKSDISPLHKDLIEDRSQHLLRISYRLEEPSNDNRVAAFYSFIIGMKGYVQLAAYFDDESDLSVAMKIMNSVNEVLPSLKH